LSDKQQGRADVKSLTIYLVANYQLARFVSVFGEYQFFWQRTSGDPAARIDVDQNRVRVGVQFGYPFVFD
ncbi:MAG: hypothetical protein ACRELZ_15090, partial [Candidatus Rokuibacteriota bacterium]